MPLRPNLIERQLLKRGVIPGLLVDLGVATFKQEVLIGAIETGVFDHLRDGALTTTELAERSGCAERGIENLVRALLPLGYLEPADGRYRLTAAARRGLPEENLQGMLPFFKEQIRHLALDAATGVREAPEGGIYGWERVQSGPEGDAYQEVMRWLASDLVPEVVDKVDPPGGARSMLDVGGSHGLYTVAFCKRHPELAGTIIDWKIGLQAAQRTLDDEPEVARRITLEEVDFEEADELPGGHDFAFLGQIIHGISPAGNQQLFNKLARATTAQATIAILDQFDDTPRRRFPPIDPSSSNFARGVAALLGFNLFLFSGGRSYPYPEVVDWLAAAGFADASHVALPKSPGYSLVVARRTD